MRRWEAECWSLELGGYLGRVERCDDGSEFSWWLDVLNDRFECVYSGRAATFALACAAAEAQIERLLADRTRWEILLEAANVDCREVRS